MQPLLLRGAVTGHASSTQMGQAAYIIFERCVLEKGVGGIAADIGAFEFPFNSTVLRISSCRISKQCFWTWLKAPSLGGDNHLNIIIAEYAPNVHCDRSAAPGPPWESCATVVAGMQAAKNRKVFGDKSKDPRVEVDVPFDLNSCK